MTLPDFLVIGAQRAGTTWLDGALRAHPDIYLPVRRKEVHFFDDFYDRGVEWYEGFFPPPEQAARFGAVGEVTPRYMYDPEVPARIAATVPECKLVAVLRDPVARAYSQYGLRVANLGERRPFEALLESDDDAVLDRGRYAGQLARYFALWPRERVLVLIFEELVADPEPGFAALGALLEVDPSGFRADMPRANASFEPRFPRARAAARRLAAELRRRDLDHWVNRAKDLGLPRLFGHRRHLPPMSETTRGRLRELYVPEIKELETLLGRDLSIWRQPPPRRP